MLCHDPRISDDRSVKVETENPALVFVEMCPMLPDWGLVARWANYCDEPVRAVVEHADGTVSLLSDVSIVDGTIRGQQSGDVFRGSEIRR